MRKIKGLILLTVIFISSALWLTSCGDKLHMDEDKCAEIALEYLEEKYQTEFEVIDSSEVYKYMGSAGYAEVIVNDKATEEENRYKVCVYPDGNKDENKDDYYDSYKVVSDDYMCYLMNNFVKQEIYKILENIGIENFISSVYIEEYDGIAGTSGFSADFSLPNKTDFSLQNILGNYEIGITYWLDMPESEYSDVLQESIEKAIRSILTDDDSVWCNLEIYDNETYKEINTIETYNNNKEIKLIEFSISKEEENEFK